MINIPYEQVVVVCKKHREYLDNPESRQVLARLGVYIKKHEKLKDHDYILFMMLLINKVDGKTDTLKKNWGDILCEVLGQIWVDIFDAEYYAEHLKDNFREAGLSIRDAIKKAALKQLLPTPTGNQR